MNIGIILPEIGGFSSLSLEFLKWHRVMTDLGHNIYIITGKSRSFFNNVTVMSDLFPDNDYNLDFSSKLFEITDDHADDIVELLRIIFQFLSIYR